MVVGHCQSNMGQRSPYDKYSLPILILLFDISVETDVSIWTEILNRRKYIHNLIFRGGPLSPVLLLWQDDLIIYCSRIRSFRNQNSRNDIVPSHKLRPACRILCRSCLGLWSNLMIWLFAGICHKSVLQDHNLKGNQNHTGSILGYTFFPLVSNV